MMVLVIGLSSVGIVVVVAVVAVVAVELAVVVAELVQIGC